MSTARHINQNPPQQQARPRRVRRPGKPTAHKTRYVRPRRQGSSGFSGGGPRNRLTVLLGVVLAIVLVVWVDHGSIEPAVLISVTDGDTLRASVDGKTVKVRLYGVDTPEYDQPHGAAATRALQELVRNKDIAIKERDRDRYGRLVAIVYADGESVNLQMVESGHAWWYRDYATFNASLAYAEFSARRNERGLWQNEDPTPPWEWRRSRR